APRATALSLETSCDEGFPAHGSKAEQRGSDKSDKGGEIERRGGRAVSQPGCDGAQLMQPGGCGCDVGQRGFGAYRWLAACVIRSREGENSRWTRHRALYRRLETVAPLRPQPEVP